MNSSLFLSLFFTYLALTLVLGWWVSRKNKGVDDFLLAGRGLPVFLMLGTTLATLVGTGSSMGAVGFSYANGWAGALYGIGGFMGLILCAWIFAPMRAHGFYTMSEELSFYVGANKLIKNSVGCLIFIASIGWLGAHILGGATYLSWITDIEIQSAKFLIALGFSLYILIGGYTAVVWADTLQAIVLFTGFILLTLFTFNKVGDLSTILAAQPAANTSLFAQIGTLPAISLAAVICIGVLATPSFRQRIYSARSINTARVSFVSSGILYLLFSAIPVIVGMAAYSLNPELESANFAFPYLTATILPIGIGMVVLIAGLSATLSSASSDAIAAVASLLKDIGHMFYQKPVAEENMMRYARVATLFVILLALALASISDDIIGYITKMIATVMSGLFVCGVLGRFWSRFTWQGALASLISASFTSIVILLNADWLTFWGNPILPSVFISALAGLAVSMSTPVSNMSDEEALDQIFSTRKNL
ncbi:sodium:solute symporter family protein [Alteromonadaceae bacterium M269]|nr:sodium:solute symporter family protein [Alteromonadaceae bacterium M269]